MSSISDIFSQFGQNSGYIEELYNLYLSDPSLVGENWAAFFNSISPGSNGNGLTVATAKSNGTHVATASPAMLETQQNVLRLIEAYRELGHFRAKINPLVNATAMLPNPPELDASRYNFASDQLSQTFLVNGFRGKREMPLQDLLRDLESIYCGSIGFEYAHIFDGEQKNWLRSRIESWTSEARAFSPEMKRRILDRLIEAEGFESELHKTYVGSKRFSIQGGETGIAMLDIAVQNAGALHIEEIVIGMAHRGRLNVLSHIVGKPYRDIFNEFEDQSMFSVLGSGDVKYHLGYRTKRQTASGTTVTVELVPNPSHLEFVNPVVEGIARARQDLSEPGRRARVLPILIHGDAAVTGQGVVWETLNMSDVEGYRTGGTLHLVLNNQVGFTTDPKDSRSSPYCTDLTKAIQAPVFHVNAEDVEACCWVVALALEYRQKFQRDVVVDLYCYRKYGHNEGDDPSFTQPQVYNEIATKKNVAQLYSEQLVASGVLQQSEADALHKAYVDRFQQARNQARALGLGEACPMHGRLRIPTPPTGVKLETLKQIAATLVNYPPGFTPHPKLLKILEKRVETLEVGKGIDWGFAEGLAFGSLVLEGHSVRLSGQDCGRGTFSQRHLALSHYESQERFLPFSQLSAADGARFEVFNSTLSETSVMGFEFGYASVANNALVLWEGQFGDFANGAQVIIDQFIASSEAKWNQLSGIVLMLPHGMEGQGPEHSSARLERYLQLCGEGNMVVAYPSNAAQHFHLLRRQGIMEIKRPLVVMTPKSLLRLPQAAVTADELTSGQFETILSESFGSKPKNLILCSGKVYYDIKAALDKAKAPSARLIRVEQLYPFPQYEIKKAIKDCEAKKVLWVQEEPQNMGAWSYIEPYLRERLELPVQYVGRPVGASPATGSGKRSAAEQQSYITEMLALIA